MKALAICSLLLLSSCASAPQASPTEGVASAQAEPAAEAPTAPAGMLRIPAAKIMIGRDDGPSAEGPAHEVEVAEFFIDKLEATADEYTRCVAARACPNAGEGEFCTALRPERGKHPINCIDHVAATAYCEFSGKRLPSEAEWELAARGTDGRRFPWGAEVPTDAHACFGRLANKAGTCAVGERPAGASPYGALDMSGNVWEWTATPFCAYSEPGCKREEFAGRGGSWDYENADNLSTTARAGGPKRHARDLLGVRCARSLGRK